jgi:predicted PurR-regulated permease PerM
MDIPPLLAADLDRLISRKLMDLVLRTAILGFLIVQCYLIFRPFMSLMLWSVILAVTLHPLQAWVARRLRERQGLAAVVLVLAILLGVLVPGTLLAISFADSTAAFVADVRDGTFEVPPPPDSMAGWPVIGPHLYGFWMSAHHDLGGMVARFAPKSYAITKEILGYATSAGTGMLKFLAALIIAGIWMAYASPAHAAATAMARRMVGEARGDAAIGIATSTIRAVAQGVVGIACIQALLLGAGFIVAGIPAAGILALGILLLGIMQIPAALVVLPTLVYVFHTRDVTAGSIGFAAYCLVAGSVDNVLKPLMLARGAQAPMPVILLGALGGMATEGIIGLFLGAVMMALGYQLLMAWVYGERGRAEAAAHAA